ncbi:RNA 2',3'-cyclic phosphodiesterase [Candidatus Pacearchaeota archaeon]|nr:RNA 2',3'-cyclic phosphodiesterase [Candidatus Pacearchaeota archaeon]
MKTRAFIALDLPEEAINEIKQIQENIKRKFIFTEISSINKENFEKLKKSKFSKKKSENKFSDTFKIKDFEVFDEFSLGKLDYSKFSKKISVPKTLNDRNKVFVRGKYTELENLHLTLKFLGEINNEKLEKVKKRLSELKFEEFTAKLDKIGIFSGKTPRVLWIKLKGADILQREIDNVLEDLFEKEKRFMGHITIARIKYIKEKKELIEYLKKIKTDIRFTVDKFYLKKSTLLPEGPIYEVIEEYPLK